MNETKFRILMYGNIYVNSNLLEKGIYGTNKPHLYSKDETIENIIDKAKNLINKSGIAFLSNSYFENLNQCELVDVTLNY